MLRGFERMFNNENLNARANQKFTQKALSERTDISQAEISRIENGSRNPSLSMIKKITYALG